MYYILRICPNLGSYPQYKLAGRGVRDSKRSIDAKFKEELTLSFMQVTTLCLWCPKNKCFLKFCALVDWLASCLHFKVCKTGKTV